MKRLIMLAAILTVLAVTVPHASAADSQVVTAGAVSTDSHPTVTQVAGQGQRKGFFARLWELEKRKNAAIRRMLGWE